MKLVETWEKFNEHQLKKYKNSGEYIMDYWLIKYHGITSEELLKKEPELCKTPEWYKKYSVTQKQHDEWYNWAIKKISKLRKWPIKYTKKNFGMDYLNLAPYVKKKEWLEK